MDTCDVPDDTAAALVAYIEELRSMVQDPIFIKKETDQ
jgi:type IV secretory pathway TrbF-like protein